jgi:hypothetical protein
MSGPTSTLFYLQIATVLWWLLIFRIIEFSDTIFYVLRKRYDLLSVRHVFHHTAMAVCVWMGVKFVPGGHGSFYAFCNTFTHAVSYAMNLMSSLGMKQHKPYKKYYIVLVVVMYI